MRNNPHRQRSLFTQNYSSPQQLQPPKNRWRIGHILWTAFKRLCMVYGALLLFASVVGTFLFYSSISDEKAPSLPDEMVLYMPLEYPLIEHENMAGYSFQEKLMTVRRVVSAIDSAAKDDRVKGFVTVLKGGSLSLVHNGEIRDAIGRFRAQGKFAYVYAPSYDTLGQYYLASAFEQIWLQPMGVVSVQGIKAEMPYVRKVLDTVGIEPQVFARKEYKNFFENATSTQMSDASREMMEALIGALGDTIVSGVAAGRGIEADAFEALVDKGLYTGTDALDAGLVDRLEYGDVFTDFVETQVLGEVAEDPDTEKIFVPVSRYIKTLDHERSFAAVPPVAGTKKPHVALIYAVGQIVQRDNSGSGDLSAADNLVQIIRDAVDDEDVKVIVLRIDSPGGSPTAAETIRRAVVRAREAGKPVIVSMGDAAASGGYWIAADADRIFAAPTTFTGSIGVTGGKFSLAGMWDKVGVNWDGVSWGENAGMFSLNQPFSPSQAERMNRMMDHIYERFVALVANGRGMTPEQVDKVAGGRVWTGRQALENGLVDELGGLDKALDHAAVLAGAQDRSGVKTVVMPRPKTTIEMVFELFESQVRMGEIFTSSAPMIERFDALMQQISAAFPASSSPLSVSGAPVQAQSYYPY